MNRVFRALAEPNRIAILRLIRDSELAAGQIADHFRVTRPAISQHLRVLMDAGLIDERREGTKRLYSLKPDGLEELKAFLDEFWEGRLQNLKQRAEKRPEQRNAKKKR
jgi:DNA-binding transcriptional ArsR family regulator